ncbi:hypothetical protein GCK32_002465, partial [Trichostrongylus colubriformis]
MCGMATLHEHHGLASKLTSTESFWDPKEAVQTMVHISKNLSATVPDGSNVSYRNFCGHYCDSNVVVGYFLQALYQKTSPETMTLQLTYPIADLRGIKLHLERNFYGVQTTTQNNITNIDYVKVIGAEIVDTEMNKDAQRMSPYFAT